MACGGVLSEMCFSMIDRMRNVTSHSNMTHTCWQNTVSWVLIHYSIVCCGITEKRYYTFGFLNGFFSSTQVVKEFNLIWFWSRCQTSPYRHGPSFDLKQGRVLLEYLEFVSRPAYCILHLVSCVLCLVSCILCLVSWVVHRWDLSSPQQGSAESVCKVLVFEKRKKRDTTVAEKLEPYYDTVGSVRRRGMEKNGTCWVDY